MVRNPFRREEVKKEEDPAVVTNSDKVAPQAKQVIEQEINLTLLNYKLNILLEKIEEIIESNKPENI